jgi:hypothetical protein
VEAGVEDLSTVSLIQLKEQTVERCIVALRLGHTKGPWARRDFFTDSEKECADFKEAAYCFI